MDLSRQTVISRMKAKSNHDKCVWALASIREQIQMLEEIDELDPETVEIKRIVDGVLHGDPI